MTSIAGQRRGIAPVLEMRSPQWKVGGRKADVPVETSSLNFFGSKSP